MSNETTHQQENLHHTPSYGANIMVWLILVSLTVVTVAVAGLDIGQYILPVALGIAAIKSIFVVNVFMHIKSEDLLFKVFIILVTATIAIIFTITAFDVFFRG